MNEDLQQLATYLLAIAHSPSMTDDQARQLLISRAATIQRVAIAHLPLVVAIATEVLAQHKALPQLDLILKGNVALMQAIETYDTTGPEPFSSYATRIIRAALAQDLQAS